MESIQRNGVFAGATPHRVKHKITDAVGLILSLDAPNNMKPIQEAYALYSAAESSENVLANLGLKSGEVRLYEQLQYLVNFEGATLSQAIQSVDKLNFQQDYEDVTMVEVRDELEEGESSGRIQLTMDLAKAIQLQRGVDSETAIERAIELQENLGYTTIGEGDNEHPFQMTQDNQVFNQVANSINSTVVAQIRGDFESDRQALGKIVEELTAERGIYGPWREEMFIQAEGAERHRTFLSGFETRAVRREFQEEVMDRAIEIYTEENGSPPLQAQAMFQGVGLESWDETDLRIGLTSSSDMNQNTVYSIANLDTNIALTEIGGKAVGVNMNAEQVLERFHAETNDYLNAVLEIRKKRAEERRKETQLDRYFR
jgi:hypothetical protein